MTQRNGDSNQRVTNKVLMLKLEHIDEKLTAFVEETRARYKDHQGRIRTVEDWQMRNESTMEDMRRKGRAESVIAGAIGTGAAVLAAIFGQK